MKKVVIELYDVCNRNVGLGEFTYQLAVRFAARAPMLKQRYNVQLYFVVGDDFRGAFGNDVKYITLNKFNRKWLRIVSRADLFHVTHQFCRFKNMFRAGANLMTVHDINFMYEKHGDKQQKYIDRFQRRLQLTDHLSFISNFAQSDVMQHFAPKHPSRVIYNGVTNLVNEPLGDISGFDLPADYLFHISSLQPKKNPHLLVEMMRYLPNEHLVIVGDWSTGYAKLIKDRIVELGLKNVKTLTNVSNKEKAALYKGCRGFLFPSLCEGFGLPPLEAACFGKPMFLSSLTSLPEVGGTLAYYWDELKPQRMAEVVESGLADFYAHPEKVQQTQEWVGRFDWDKCVDEYLDYYFDIMGVKK